MAKGAAPLDESATQRWPALDAEIAEDDEPSEEVGSRSLPIGGTRPRVPSPPPVGASTSASGLKVPSLGPPTAVGAASESAGSWPRTDGWDLDELGSDDAGSSVPTVPSVPSVPKLGSVPSIPSVPKLGSVPSIPSIPAIPKPAATKEVGSVPSVPKLGSVPSVPSVPKTGAGTLPKPAATKEVGSVPSVPKLGSVPKPLPKPGGPKPMPTPRTRRAAEIEEDVKPLFGTALTDDGSLAAGLGASSRSSASEEPALDALASFAAPTHDAEIDASAPPSSASPLDALPSFEAGPTLDGVPQDGIPSLDSSLLLGAALEPVGDFVPAPVQSGLAPIATADDDDEPLPSVPRLPVPGMLRDGLAPAADFRATPRTPRSPQPLPAMAPVRGMVPPKHRDGEESRLLPNDTQALVAQVAEELAEQAERHRAEKAAAAAAAVEAPRTDPAHAAAVPVSAPAAASRPSVAPASVVPLAAAYPSTREVEAKRRGKLLAIGAIGVAAAIGLFVWLSQDDGASPPTQTAAVTGAAAPPAAAADDGAAAEPEPPAPAPPAAPEVAAEPEVAEPEVAAPEVAASTSGAAEAEPAIAASTGGAEAVEGEAAGEAATAPAESGAGSSSRKGSGKSGRSGKGDATQAAPKDEPAPAKTDEAPSAAKLLKQARSAYDAGKGSTAYSLASKSNRMEPTGEAAEVMALAACLMKDADKAKSALRTVPLFSRAGVRNTCKTKHGVKLGL